MGQVSDLVARCLEVVTLLDQEYTWQLTEEERLQLARSVARYASDDHSAAKLKTIVLNYRADYAQIELLRAEQHVLDSEAWATWVSEVVGILMHSGLYWSNDVALDKDDLAQVARLELARSLDNFRYASRLKTWVYSVVTRSAHRELQKGQAHKRAVRPESLDQVAEVDAPVNTVDDIESGAVGRLLVERCTAILRLHANERLAYIFTLWAVEDRAVEEIGRLISLHPSRVRTLLGQARTLLRNHPDIQRWKKEFLGDDDS